MKGPKQHRGVSLPMWTDEKFVALSPMARLLWIGSWHYCCDEGHLMATPVELKMRVLPADNCDVHELFAEIVGQGLYVGDPVTGYQVPNLAEHQKVDKRWMLTCERCPAAPASTGSREDHASTTRGAREDHGATRAEEKRREEKRSEGGAGVEPPRRKRSTKAPDALDLDDDDRAWAAEKAPNVDLAEATEEFLTWAKSVDKRYVDWKAAWRNALKRRQEWAVRDGRHLSPVPDDDTPDWMRA